MISGVELGDDLVSKGQFGNNCYQICEVILYGFGNKSTALL